MRVGTILVTVWLAASPAAAQSGFNFGPDPGQQVARGSAWVARADSALATFFNPAALPRQDRSAHFGGNLMSMDRCFTRVDSAGAAISPGGGLPAPGTPNGPPADVCMAKTPFFNTQMAVTFGITDRLKFGAAIVAPHSMGKISWPESVTGPAGPQPAASRFMLVDEDSVLAYPTFSLGYQVTPTFAVGAGFISGFFTETASLMGEALSSAGAARDDFIAHHEVKLFVEGADHFIPGVVVSFLWSPRPTIDVAGWYKHTASVNATADVKVQSRYWTSAGVPNLSPCTAAEGADCNITDPSGIDGRGTENIPSEARGGIRYHRPRDSSAKKTHDPMVDDAFDIEFDVGWANNSMVTQALLELAPVAGTPLKGVPGGKSTLPPTAGVVKNWKDILSLRFGGEYVVKPGKLAVQAGGWFETKGQDDAYLHIHFDEAQKFGFAGGAMFRVTPRFDVHLAYQHVFWADLDNHGTAVGVAVSGDPLTNYVSRQTIDGGKLTSGMHELATGVTFRF